jgi:Flp pilus assembly protein TadG
MKYANSAAGKGVTTVMGQPGHSRRTLESGQTLAEFALVVPLLLLLVFGTIEFGRVLNAYIVVTNGAREGARYGATGYTAAQIQTQVAGSTASLGVVTTTVTNAQGARGSQITVKVSYSFSFVVPLIGDIFHDQMHGGVLPISATAVMRIE